MNKAVLLQLQQAKAKASRELETRNHMKQVYDNMSYEDNEVTQEPDKISTKPPKDASRPSQMVENQEDEKEVRVDRF